ncbi:MAG: hypothetical protein HOJ16_05115 [Candidatus Peribacter sp.]|jgi:hypothetical protein|nr:hypothetical protein [Candidatus Peribacter sp.]
MQDPTLVTLSAHDLNRLLEFAFVANHPVEAVRKSAEIDPCFLEELSEMLSESKNVPEDGPSMIPVCLTGWNNHYYGETWRLPKNSDRGELITDVLAKAESFLSVCKDVPEARILIETMAKKQARLIAS